MTPSTYNLLVAPIRKHLTACTHLGSKIKTRTQSMRLQGNRDIFADRDRLQAWLLETNPVGDVGLDAELKMERIRMSSNESVEYRT